MREDDLSTYPSYRHSQHPYRCRFNIEKSPEARICEGAFTQMRAELAELLRDCATGRELHERGFGADVEHAARLNAYEAVPVLRDGRLCGL